MTAPALPASRRRTWPLTWRDGATLLAWFAGMVALWWAVGALITGAFGGSRLVHTDEAVSRWFADHRTPWLDHVALSATQLGESYVKVAVAALAVVLVAARWRSWREVLMIAVPLALEASSFILVTWLVGRPRPDVPRLQDSPVASSWPSGHTAAAAAYASIVVVVWWHCRHRVVRVLAVVAVALVTIAVGWARTYAGMHHLSDVIAGALLGAVAVGATWSVLRSPAPRAAGVPEAPTVTAGSSRAAM
jgi:membrane-associated phospholipid phosphatase